MRGHCRRAQGCNRSGIGCIAQGHSGPDAVLECDDIFHYPSGRSKRCLGQARRIETRLSMRPKLCARLPEVPAGNLFGVDIIAVGFLAVPIMATGTAYDFSQAFGWSGSLHVRSAGTR